MMAATAILRKEHQSILRMLDNTERVAQWIERGGRPDPSALRDILWFLQLYLTRWHCNKEERLLFPLLEEKGLSRRYGRLQGILCEHKRGQALVEELAEHTDAYAHGEWVAAARWAEAASEYADFMRRHIAQEEKEVFGIAETLLTDTDQQKLAASFDEIERDFVANRGLADDETAEFPAISVKK